jgi:hypothetical protein
MLADGKAELEEIPKSGFEYDFLSTLYFYGVLIQKHLYNAFLFS